LTAIRLVPTCSASRRALSTHKPVTKKRRRAPRPLRQVKAAAAQPGKDALRRWGLFAIVAPKTCITMPFAGIVSV
jgi:hypothetical protein